MQQCPLSMTLADWRSDLGDFIVKCGESGPGEQAGLLRKARDLLLVAPGPMRDIWPALPGEEALEAMIAIGAHESAALALLGENAGYMLSRGGNGACLASVILPASGEDQTSEGVTPALALLAAMALALSCMAKPKTSQHSAALPGQAVRMN